MFATYRVSGYKKVDETWKYIGSGYGVVRFDRNRYGSVMRQQPDLRACERLEFEFTPLPEIHTEIQEQEVMRI